MVAMASTHAKMGRLMKNLDMVVMPLVRVDHRGDLNQHTWSYTLATFDNDVFTRIQPFSNHPLVVHHPLIANTTRLNAPFFVDDIDRRALIAQHQCLIGD